MRVRVIALPGLLVLVGALTYANSLDGPFFFDDAVSIVENENLRQLWPPARALTSTSDSPVAGRPVVSLTLAVNYAIGGENVLGYHVVNIAAHICCALVLYGIVRRTLRLEVLRDRLGRHAALLAFGCALIWMVHPIQTECVNYVTQRTETIMALFYLLTLYCAIRAADSTHAVWWSIASVASCALGMASKEVMVTAPVMVVVYDWSFRTGAFKEVLRRRAGLYGGLASTWVVLAVLMVMYPHTESVGATEAVSHFDYALNQSRVVMLYLKLSVWPHPLVIDYGSPTPVGPAAVAPYGLALAAGLAATLVALVRRSPIGFPGAWFFVVLAPTSSIVPIVTEVAAERRMYLSLAAVVVGVVLAVYALLERLAARRPDTAAGLAPRFGLGAAAALVVALIWTTVRRNAEYRDPIELWRTAHEVNPGNHRPPNNMGILLRARGRPDEAIAWFRRALELRPDAPRIHYNLGNALAAMDRSEEAVAAFRGAIILKPDYADAHHNLAVALGKTGAVDDAILHFREALRYEPDDSATHSHLAIALRVRGRGAEAATHFQRAIELDPANTEAHRNLGVLLQVQGDLDGAVSHYRRALESDPADAATHLNLGAALHAQGRLDEAIGQAELLESMAAAHAAAGRLEQAAFIAELGLRLATTIDAPELARRINGKLEDYRQGRK